MAAYTYVTANVLTGQVIEEIPFRSVKWAKELNGPGSFTAVIDADHPKAARNNLLPAARFVYVVRNGVAVWGGIIWVVRNTGGELEVSAQGIWSYFRRRRIRWDATFTSTDQFSIAQSLMNTAATQPGAISVTVPATTSGVLRDRSFFAVERKQLGEAVEQLANVENGFDFEIVTSLSGATFTNSMVFYHPKQGRRLSAVWDVSVHASVDSWEVDGSDTTNLLTALGAGDGQVALVVDAADPGQFSTYPLLEDTVSYKDVVEVDTLDSHARADLQRRSKPKALPEMTLIPTAETEVGSFVVGDEIQLRGNRGWTELDGWYRIVSYDVEVSDEGDERIAVQVVDTEQVPL